jgi:hypothetical protein
VNGHWDYTQNPASIISSLKSLGMTTYRATWEGSDSSLNVLVALAQAFHNDGTGLKLYCCIDIDLTSNGSTFWPSEAAAYSYGFTSGAHVAAALAPYVDSVIVFECGNELTRKHGMAPIPSIMGTKIQDFDNTKWPILRGICTGCMDGVKSVLPNSPCASPAFTFAEIGAINMLWNGWNPDGTTGYRAMKWDVTALHSYHTWGDPANMFFDGPGTGPQFDYMKYCATTYKVPIVFSEWNGDADSQTQSDLIAWITKMYDGFYRRRYELNIAAVMIYALYSDPWNILVDATGLPNPVGTAVQTFITNNPDV